MPPNWDLLLEAERRGILPAEKQTLLTEARSRGLVPGETPVAAAPPSLLEQVTEPFSRALSTTGSEFTGGLEQAFNPPPRAPGIISNVVGGAQQVMGLVRAALAPVTGFMSEPLERTMMASAPASMPEPVKEVLAKTAGGLGAMIAPSPMAIVRGVAAPMLGRMAQRQATKGMIESEQLARQAAQEGVQSELEAVQGAAQGVGRQADEATQALNIAQGELAQAKGLKAARQAVPEIPELAPDPFTAQAIFDLHTHPLRVTPTQTSLQEAGTAYVGTPGSPGLFRTAAQGVKQNLTDRLMGTATTPGILPDAPVTTLDPLRKVVEDIVPRQRISGLGIRSEQIASRIQDTISKGGKDLSGAEELASEMDKIQRSLGKGDTLNLNDLLSVKDFPTTQAAMDAFIQGRQTMQVLPLIKDVQSERVLLRAMKRAADKSGQAVLQSQLGKLETAYTDVINQSLGPEKAAALKAWDKDYAYGVGNLFGYDSLPYKLSGKNSVDASLRAERFADSLFKRTPGGGENTRIQRVMELLGPEQKTAMGETFLQTVSKKSQTPEMPFDPQKWGKEYLAYKDPVKEAVLSPDHKKALDDIARTFVQTPVRQQAAEVARQAAVDLRKQGITQATQGVTEAGAVQRATGQRLQGIQEQLPALKQYSGELTTEMKALGQPTIAEKAATEQLKKLNDPGSFMKTLNSMEPFLKHRVLYGIGGMILHYGYGVPHAIEGGAMLIGVDTLRAAMNSPAGAKFVATLAKSRPGTEAAMRAAAGLNALIRPEQPTE